VAAEVVGGETGGEGDTFFQGFIFSEHFFQFGFDKGIAESADFGHAGIGQAFFDYFLQAQICDFAGLLVFIYDAWGRKGFFPFFLFP